MKSLSHVLLLAISWTAAHQAPSSMGFSRQEYWSGVPLPSPAADLTSDNFIYKMGLTVYNLSISKRTNMNLSGDKKYTLDTFKTGYKFRWLIKTCSTLLIREMQIRTAM